MPSTIGRPMTFDSVRYPPAGTLLATDFVGWGDPLHAEFAANAHNGRVGTRLLSESDRVRVWEIRLDPGERVPAHLHVLDYFWTALTAGTSVQHTSDGTSRRVHYEAGQTRHHRFGPGEYLLHDLENTGTTTLYFSTVELLESANAPLPLNAIE